MQKVSIAGLCLKGGRKDNFFLCLLEDYEDGQRLFLKSLLQVKDDQELDSGDQAITAWIEKFELKQMVVDFPQSLPLCQSCQLHCPGRERCPQSEVSDVRARMEKLLADDQALMDLDPKDYERRRLLAEEIDTSRDILQEPTDQPLLSRSFKRKLRKGYLPYWNRPLDLWIWCRAYDQMLKFFGQSYDSFGNSSLMLHFRFSYLKRHFPLQLQLFESNIWLFLIELLRAKVVKKNQLSDLMDIELGAKARMELLKTLEQAFSLFIYESDQELLIRDPRAFQSFLLGLAGWFHLHQHSYSLPAWAKPHECHFILPAVPVAKK